MSVRLMKRIWKAGPEDATSRFVLLAIAHSANGEGCCSLSVETIGQKARMSRTTVWRALGKLQAGGWLTVQSKAGQERGNSYQLALTKLGLEQQVSGGVKPELFRQECLQELGEGDMAWVNCGKRETAI